MRTSRPERSNRLNLNHRSPSFASSLHNLRKRQPQKFRRRDVCTISWRFNSKCGCRLFRCPAGILSILEFWLTWLNLQQCPIGTFSSGAKLLSIRTQFMKSLNRNFRPTFSIYFRKTSMNWWTFAHSLKPQILRAAYFQNSMEQCWFQQNNFGPCGFLHLRFKIHRFEVQCSQEISVYE